MSFDWKGMLGKIAPALAATLGGPAAGIAVGALCKAVGLEPTLENAQKAAEMAAAGSLTGEQFVALQQAELEHKEKMAQLGYKSITDIENIAYQDRDSARKREMSVKDLTPQIGFYAITIGFFGILFYMFKYSIPEVGRDAMMVMLGSLGTAWIQAVSYYYGSSSGSDSKTRIIADKIDKS